MSRLDAARIACLVPHAGAMVLLDEVLQWDELRLLARTRSHRRPDNPLRDASGLALACGIEYAAQAMALHAALRRPAGAAPPRAGLLASLRDLQWGPAPDAQRLDEIDASLEVQVWQVGGDARLCLYEFALHAGSRRLLAGRAAVVLDADALSGAGA